MEGLPPMAAHEEGKTMSNWVMGSEPYPDGSRDLTITFQNDDSNGQIVGQLYLKGQAFHVDGNWAAAGSIAGRNFSAFSAAGSNQQDATVYVAAGGTMIGSGAAPQSITVNVVRASSVDGTQTGWDGLLKPM
jgi:hypothetical protein